jgi:hypothetical protein
VELRVVKLLDRIPGDRLGTFHDLCLLPLNEIWAFKARLLPPVSFLVRRIYLGYQEPDKEIDPSIPLPFEPFRFQYVMVPSR